LVALLFVPGKVNLAKGATPVHLLQDVFFPNQFLSKLLFLLLFPGGPKFLLLLLSPGHFVMFSFPLSCFPSLLQSGLAD